MNSERSTQLIESHVATLPIDTLGIGASALCIVHCLLTPVLLSFSTLLAHVIPSEEGTHRSIAVIVALFGTIALVRGYRTHRRKRIPTLMASGLACIAFAACWGDHLPTHSTEVLITAVGSTFMICAHRLNHTFCKDCRCACQHTET